MFRALLILLFTILSPLSAMAEAPPFQKVERWILSWGEHATVLEPLTMVRRIRKIANAPEQRYPASLWKDCGCLTLALQFNEYRIPCAT